MAAMSEDQVYPLPVAAVMIPLLAAISIILNIPPLISHIRNHNIPAASLVLWFVEVNFINFLNALIWPTDDVAHWFDGKILCDIEIKLMPAAYIGVVGALIGIMKNLARILDTDNSILAQTRAQKQRQKWLDILLCWGVPCIFMVLHYVVQSARFVVYTVSGCSTPYHLSWVTVVLIYMWPPILSFVVFYYCILVLHRMRKYRRDFSSILSSSDSSLSRNRFMRLFLMSIILIFILFPAQTYILYDFVRQVSYPYRWSVVHGPHWGDIILIPTSGTVTPDHWIQIAVGFVIFGFFGLGHDAQEMYRRWLLRLALGRIFPSLHFSTRERRRLKETQRSGTSSVGSGARLLKAKLVRPSWTARHVQSSHVSCFKVCNEFSGTGRCKVGCTMVTKFRTNEIFKSNGDVSTQFHGSISDGAVACYAQVTITFPQFLPSSLCCSAESAYGFWSGNVWNFAIANHQLFTPSAQSSESLKT